MDIGKISSAGLGSGLDVNGIVTQLMALERKPIEQLDQSKSKVEAQLSGLGKLQSGLSAVRDAASRLTTGSAWSPTTVTSTDQAAVSAISTGTTPPGNYAVEVRRLASAQSLTSTTVPGPTTVVGTGTLTFEIGEWFTNPPDFTPNAGANAVSITITEADNTLEKIRDRINESDAGVSASIVNDATGSRLALRSLETGQTNGFRITVNDADGDGSDALGLSRLAYDANSAVASPMTRTQTAANADLSINNIPISSASNTLTDVLDGMTVRVSRVTTAPVELAVNRDTEAIKKSITEFATAYNGLMNLMREQTAYNESSKTGGALQGDRTAVGLMSKLRTLVGGSSGANATFTRLADVGLEPQRDGTLKVNTTKLDGAVGRLDDLRSFFSRDAEGSTNDGFGTMLRQFAALQIGSDGNVTSRTESAQARLDSIKARTTNLEERLVQKEKSLRAQYTRLDSNMAALSGLQSYISQQVAQWNK
jgi:flagellar hook-associated protein 2